MKRSIWIPDKEWTDIKARAEISGLSIGKYVISACREPAGSTISPDPIPQVREKEAKIVSKPPVITTQDGLADAIQQVVDRNPDKNFIPYSKGYQTRKTTQKRAKTDTK